MNPVKTLAITLVISLSISLGLNPFLGFNPFTGLTHEHPLGFDFELLPLTATDLESAFYVYDFYRALYIAAHSERGVSCLYTINSAFISSFGSDRRCFDTGIRIPDEFTDAVLQHSRARRNYRMYYSGIDWKQWCIDNDCPQFIKHGQCLGTHSDFLLELYLRGRGDF
jgi:hypothetical protein